MFEPIQGEAGAIVPPEDFWPRVREITNLYKVLLIADEVQTGLTGPERCGDSTIGGMVPDIMAAAKSLSGGVMM